ncbi:MAG TPA: hypothetical protein VE843_02245 [Ktedonobacteraceae bacterium]|nr:hypothetical protein [Ktedonobacteraceae bacterium]
MRRWVFYALLVIFLTISVFFLKQRITVPPKPIYHLARTPHSAYKYNLCTEATAYAHATPDNPYKTDFTFQDPFRNAKDTIIPLLWDQNLSDQTVSFKVKIIVGQLDTFTELISHVAVLDGISILLPDQQGQWEKSSIPQFIVSSLERNGTIAILDFTCSEQWKWVTT